MKVTTDSCLFGSLLPGLPGNGKAKNILDIGTGTGLLSLMFAQKNQQAVIDAIEIDKGACLQATENVSSSPWKKNIQVLHADINDFTFLKKYDLIACNPPFYENDLKGDDLQKNIAQHSEKMTLASLLPVIKNNLSEGGTYYLLLPFKRLDEVKKQTSKNKLNIEQIVFIKPTVHHPCFRIVVNGNCKNYSRKEPTTTEIAIKDKDGQYTREFVLLLKDYYLHL